MDFITDQEQARKRTGRLVIFFAIAVLLTVSAVYALVMVVLKLTASEDTVISWWQPAVLGWAGGGTIAVIAIGSLIKTGQLSSGGRAVAEALGGHLVHPDSREPTERRLLNVVEEMAIASGCPVPPVYLIDDQSINAFAAGFAFDSAVIGVTRGCVEQLNRDELQGVIAHEFSHVVNGDMRLNIRLTGVIFGIMAIGFIGYILFRFVAPSMLYSGGGRGRDNNGAAVGLAVLAIGIALVVIGALGTLFARLIQAAVSRQREFLADAAAVDFTRNPAGISGALKRIGGIETNDMKQAAASEFQHFFFTPALHTLMATHPPLQERIERIENRPLSVDEMSAPADAPGPGMTAAAAGFAAGGAAGSRSMEIREAAQVRESVTHLGDADPARLAYARAIMAFIPDPVRDAVHEPIGAQAVCLLLLVDQDPRVAGRQAKEIEKKASDTVQTELVRIKDQVLPVVARSPELRMVLADLSMPALARLSDDASKQFIDLVQAMIRADNRLDRFEWVLGRLLTRHLRHLSPRRTRDSAPRRSLASLNEHARLVLAMLAWSGARSEAQAMEAFRVAAGAADLGNLDLPGREDCTVERLDLALNALESLRFKDRGRLLEAAVDGVCADGHATLAEVELLRAIASALDCPMPPVLPGAITPAG
ncbi:MAG: M48 family metallopeptidase [Phycisphaerales bacterium]|nr:M48 family metallopeptidase [Phycisphaerales bacterium]